MKKRSRLIIAGLMIIILICSLIPVPADLSGYFDSTGTPEASQIFSSRLQNAEPILLNPAQKQLVHKISIRKSPEYVFPISFLVGEGPGRALPVRSIDLRGRIRDMIPHYFNGSKYRQIHLEG